MNKFLLLFCTFLCAFTLSAQWQRLEGFNNGHVYGLTAQDGYLFAATMSGIYRTQNPEQGWEHVTEGDASQYYLRIFNFGDELYATGAEGSLGHRSSDLGETWQTINSGSNALFVAFAKAHDAYYARTTNLSGLYRSYDGETWETVYPTNFPTQASILGIGDDLYAWSDQGNDVLYRADENLVFEPISVGSIDALFYSAGLLFVKTTTGLIVSDDGGETWMEPTITEHIDQSGGLLLGATAFQGKWILGLTSPYAGLLISNDQGETWQFFPMESLEESHENFTEFNGSLYGGSAYHSAGKIDFVGDTPVHTQASNGISTSSLNQVVTSGNTVYGERLFHDFYEINLSDNSMSVAPTFQGTELTAVNQPQAVVSFNQGAMYFFNSPKQLFVKLDDSENFTDISGNLYDELNARTPWSVLYVDDILYYFDDWNYLFVSDDFGATWVNKGESPLAIYRPIFAHGNGVCGFQGSGASELAVTYDQGDTYESMGDVPVALISFAASNGERIVVSFANSMSYTDDEGETWTTYDFDETHYRMLHISDSPNTIVAMGYLSENRFWISHDMGGSFELLTADGVPPSSPFDGKYAITSTHLIYQIDHGNIYYITRSEAGIETNIAEFSQPVESLKLYPNPSRGSVQFDVLTEPMIMTVFALNGQMIAQELLNPGTVSYDFGGLTAGCYIINMTGTKSKSARTSRLLIE